MSKNKISFGVIVGAISLAIDSLAGLIILPILLKYLTKELAGLWVFFISFTSLINLGQAGLGPVVTRKSAELKGASDANELSKFYRLVNVSYSLVSILVLVICAIIYFSYIARVIKPINSSHDGSLSWLIISAGYAFRMYSVKNYHVINGFGEVGWDKLTQIVISIINIVLFYLVLKSGYGVLSLSVVFLFCNILHLIASTFMFNIFAPKVSPSSLSAISKEDILHLFSQSSKMLVLNLVGFVVMNTDIFIVERLFGLEILPQFNALVKIVWLIIAVTSLFTSMVYPYIALSWAQHDHKKCRKLYLKSVQTSVIVGVIMSALSLYLAPYIIPKWVGIYLGPTLFSLQLLFGLIYIHHTSHASAVIATNSNSFITPAIVNALISLPLSIIGGYYFGLNGIVIGNIIATVIPSIYVVLWSYRFFNRLQVN